MQNQEAEGNEGYETEESLTKKHSKSDSRDAEVRDGLCLCFRNFR
jgi:hypothetical protein